ARRRGRQGRSGQPAQLGRQGNPRGALPREALRGHGGGLPMMPWRRHRRKRPALDERAQADAWQAVSLLLDYPDERLLSLLPLLGETAAGLPEHVGGPLTTFVEHAISADPEELRAEYVDSFDH